MQENEVQEILDYVKVSGEYNPVDGLAKHLITTRVIRKYPRTVNLRLSGAVLKPVCS